MAVRRSARLAGEEPWNIQKLREEIEDNHTTRYPLSPFAVDLIRRQQNLIQRLQAELSVCRDRIDYLNQQCLEKDEKLCKATEDIGHLRMQYNGLRVHATIKDQKNRELQTFIDSVTAMEFTDEEHQ